MPGAAPAVPAPEPGLTAADLLARAQALRPALRARQGECEALGRLPAATQRDFLAAGFYRIVQPRRFGGYECDVPAFIREMMEVARGCPASGWVLALTAGHALVLGLFPEAAQAEAYGRDGDFRAPHVGSPTGRLEPAAGGYRLSGAWDYASGCDLATHFLATARLAGAAEGAAEGVAFALVERADLRILDNWDTIGMRGTGSRRIIVADAAVPAHRIVRRLAADGTPAALPGHGVHANPLYRGPLASFLVGELAAVAVGAARGAVDLYEERLRARTLPFPPATPLCEHHEYQRHFDRAHQLVATAEAALIRCGEDYMALAASAAAAGRPVADAADREMLLVEQQAVQLAWEAVDLVFRTAGTSGGTAQSPLGRHFRDLAMIRTHVTAQYDRTAENWARLRFGLPPLAPL